MALIHLLLATPPCHSSLLPISLRMQTELLIVAGRLAWSAHTKCNSLFCSYKMQQLDLLVTITTTGSARTKDNSFICWYKLKCNSLVCSLQNTTAWSARKLTKYNSLWSARTLTKYNSLICFVQNTTACSDRYGYNRSTIAYHAFSCLGVSQHRHHYTESMSPYRTCHSPWSGRTGVSVHYKIITL